MMGETQNICLYSCCSAHQLHTHCGWSGPRRNWWRLWWCRCV